MDFGKESKWESRGISARRRIILIFFVFVFDEAQSASMKLALSCGKEYKGYSTGDLNVKPPVFLLQK